MAMARTLSRSRRCLLVSGITVGALAARVSVPIFGTLLATIATSHIVRI